MQVGQPLRVQIIDYTVERWTARTRMPFKYGIATMTEVPHLFLFLTCRVGKAVSIGCSADHLPPKWFTKEAGVPVEREIEDMEASLQRALAVATRLESDSPFRTWWQLYNGLMREPEFPPLLQHFGISLVERALLDAVCRCLERPLWMLVRDEELGIELGALSSELAGEWTSRLLPSTPLEQVTLRHTVGLADYLSDAEIPSGERVEDGLPQSLEACIPYYGLREFKIKVCGELAEDLGRLKHIVRVLRASCPWAFRFSLDGNEQFTSVEQLRAFGEAIHADAELAPAFEHLLFIEQPINRKVALSSEADDIRAAWPRPVPIIIDESDGALEDFPRAMELGYAGVSHKNCKGVFKGIRNKCLIARRQRLNPRGDFLMTGEDLTNIGPIALTQDLAVQGLLGNGSVERNGHHYFRGLSLFPESVSAAVEALHPGLYALGEDGVAYLQCRDGQLDLKSVNAAPFGSPIKMPGWPDGASASVDIL